MLYPLSYGGDGAILPKRGHACGARPPRPGVIPAIVSPLPTPAMMESPRPRATHPGDPACHA